MNPVVHQYKLRLTNLSQANRSLKLAKLSVRRDIDLTALSFLNQLSGVELLSKLIAGQSVPIIKSLSARDENVNLADRHLNKIWHSVNTIYEETGTYDLFLGYPFVEGKFLDGSIARCPLVLFPVKLLRNFQGSPRWMLKANSDEDLAFNKTFFLAYEKFMQVRLSKAFWEDKPERHHDLQGFLNALYKQLNAHEIELHFNSELFQFRIDHFMDKNQAMLEALPLGKLRLTQNAVVGIFPQSDSALLQDYETIAQQPEKFKLDVFFAPQAVSSPSPAYVKEDERYYVAAVDQSQEEGLLKVRNGRSLVVHGPPGTGKSQVILNLISDALARGEKVLVCSQKRAALDVVYQRMAEHGLGRFAALVHDFRDDRNKIFDRIRQQIDDIEKFEAEGRDIGFDIWLRDFRRDSRKLDEYNHFFESLNKAQNTNSRFGISPFELYLNTLRFTSSFDLGDLAVRFDLESLNTFLDKLGQIVRYAEFFANSHPWRWRLSFHSQAPTAKSAMTKRLALLSQELESMHTSWNELRGPGKQIPQVEDYAAAIDEFRNLRQVLEFPEAIDDLSKAEADQLKVKELSLHLKKLRDFLNAMEDFTIIDGLPLLMNEDLQANFKTYSSGKAKASRFFSKAWLKSWWYVRQLLKRRGLKLEEKSLKQLAKELKALDGIIKYVLKINHQVYFSAFPLTETIEVLKNWWATRMNNLPAIEAWRNFKSFPSLRPKVSAGNFDHDHFSLLKLEVQLLQKLHLKIASLRQDWAKILHPRQISILQKGILNPEIAHGFLENLSERIENDFEDLVALDLLLQQLLPIEKSAMERIEEELAEADASKLKNFSSNVKQAFFQAWLLILEAAHPELLEVSSRAMPEKIEAYRNLLTERRKVIAGLIQRKLKDAIVNKIEYNRLNNPVTYREIAHQVRKKRQLWSVRKLIQNYWHEGLGNLMPCWMASPESVAAIFPMEKDYFDLVIFDEASQCYVERALPVILRGKQSVIAGDDKQLPPFDLYSVKVEEEEGAFFEDEMALEVESVLDLARNVFDECKLNWHYRSSEEELINFSNHAFYDGRLNITPSAQHEAISIPPLEYIKVDGIWEKNRNEIEAQKVVALVEELVMRPENPSIGIVTFNFHQKELIWALLEARQEALAASNQEALLSRLQQAMVREEGEARLGIFVKNIENVQGDERDVIIFSIGYAPDRNGRMIANFGLLNQKGGGNRLNVAITRARKKGIVVCSIEPEALKVDGALHEGPRLLRSYLSYAKAVGASQNELVDSVLKQIGSFASVEMQQSNEVGSQLAYQVEQLLNAKGWQTLRQIGDTNFKLDLAVVDEKGEFLMGIECEGQNYNAGKTAKEREIYKPLALEQRGWKIYRVWARNFYLNPEAEIEKIIKSLVVVG